MSGSLVKPKTSRAGLLTTSKKKTFGNIVGKGENADNQHFLLSLPFFQPSLTHYQTTNFRLFQTERVCRWQFQIRRKWQKVIQTGRKQCGKRRNCSLRAISPFPTVFSKGLLPRGIKRCHCVGMGLNNYCITFTFAHTVFQRLLLSLFIKVNPFPNKSWFLCVCSTILLKILEKGKIAPTVFFTCLENFLPLNSSANSHFGRV